MGFQSTTAAFQVPGLSGPQKAVLVALAHCRNEKTRQCNPSQATLAIMTSLDERTVRRAIDHLEQVGIVSRQAPRYVRRARLSDQYQLHLPTTGLSDRYGQSDQSLQSDEEADSVPAIDAGLSARQTGKEQELKGQAPSQYCARHPAGTSAPCGPCGAAREAYELWRSSQRRPAYVGQCPAVLSRGAHRFVGGFCAECSIREETAA